MALWNLRLVQSETLIHCDNLSEAAALQLTSSRAPLFMLHVVSGLINVISAVTDACSDLCVWRWWGLTAGFTGTQLQAELPLKNLKLQFSRKKKLNQAGFYSIKQPAWKKRNKLYSERFIFHVTDFSPKANKDKALPQHRKFWLSIRSNLIVLISKKMQLYFVERAIL